MTQLTLRKSTQADRKGEIRKELPGPKSMACIERGHRNLGDPVSSRETG